MSRYLKVLFDYKKKGKLLKSLNPLKNISVQIVQNGRIVDKHLSFSFSRVIRGKKVVNVLTSVSDISREIELQAKLEQESKRGDQQVDLLTTLLNCNADLLPGFIQNSDQTLSEMNNVLRDGAKTQDEYRVKVDRLGTLAHKVKGESAALSIGMVSNACHEFEDELARLKTNHHIDGNNFLPLTIILERLIGYVELIKDLHERVFSKQSVVTNLNSTAQEGNTSSSWDHLFDYSKKIAERMNKAVNFRVSGLNYHGLPEGLKTALPVLTSQFIRNAISHGIEGKNEREKVGKKQAGSVSITLYEEENGFVFECMDDGSGLDMDKVSKAAIEKGIVTQQELEDMSAQQKISLIFKPNFSTNDSIDEDSGRGMGMSAINDVVKSLNGNMSISTKEGSHTRFSIRFPNPVDLLKSA